MASSSELTRVAQELYVLLPEEFTAARTAAEKAARGAGDRSLAAEVKALRRPAAAAWAVNQLVRQRAELANQVVELGAALRQAQAGLQGEALRELTRQRRQLVAAVTTEARRLAAARGQRLSEAAARQVEETLQAAMADPEAGEAVLRGTLSHPLSSTGMGSLGGDSGEGGMAVGEWPGGPGAGSEESSDPASGSAGSSSERPALSVVRDEGRARRKAEKRVEETRRTLKAATKEHRSAQKRRDKAEAKVLQVAAELDELRRRVAELEEASEAAAERLEEEQSALEGAAATLADAEHAAEAAAAALEGVPAPPPGG